MSSDLSAKRRRLNDSTHALTKPFVSPLRTSNPNRTPLQATNNAPNTAFQPSTLAHTVNAASPPVRTASTLSKPPTLTPAKPTPYPNRLVFSTSSHRPDPAEVAARKAVTGLELQIRRIRNDIDALKQASHLNNSTTDSDLKNLVLKWKLAAQNAAEEIFGNVKERVSQMGGVSAWKESEKRKYDRSYGFSEFKEEVKSDDADCEFDSQGEELPEDEQEYRRARKKRARKEMEDAADPGDVWNEEDEKVPRKIWQEESPEDDTFTVDMMLKSLGIELDVIGYDKVAQTWLS